MRLIVMLDDITSMIISTYKAWKQVLKIIEDYMICFQSSGSRWPGKQKKWIHHTACSETRQPSGRDSKFRTFKLSDCLWYDNKMEQGLVCRPSPSTVHNTRLDTQAFVYRLQRGANLMQWVGETKQYKKKTLDDLNFNAQQLKHWFTYLELHLHSTDWKLDDKSMIICDWQHEHTRESTYPWCSQASCASYSVARFTSPSWSAPLLVLGESTSPVLANMALFQSATAWILGWRHVQSYSHV